MKKQMFAAAVLTAALAFTACGRTDSGKTAGARADSSSGTAETTAASNISGSAEIAGEDISTAAAAAESAVTEDSAAAASSVASAETAISYDPNDPKPAAPTASIASGEYYSDQVLELDQQNNLQIYYKTNGEKPERSDSNLFTGKFTLVRGRTLLKADCYSDKNVPSDLLEEEIDIFYPLQGTQNSLYKGKSVSGVSCDYAAADSGIASFGTDGKFVSMVSTAKNCRALCYGGRVLYYCDSSGIRSYSEDAKKTALLAKVQTDEMAVNGSRLWYLSSGKAVSCDLSGANPRTAGDLSGLASLDVSDGTVYVGDGTGKVWTIDRSMSVYQLADAKTGKNVDSVACVGGYVYFTSDGKIYRAGSDKGTAQQLAGGDYIYCFAMIAENSHAYVLGTTGSTGYDLYSFRSADNVMTALGNPDGYVVDGGTLTADAVSKK